MYAQLFLGMGRSAGREKPLKWFLVDWWREELVSGMGPQPKGWGE